ncbi:MAG: hypothetical protein LBG24_03935 [Treponema sp.]|nr:hypothetical protein [Treponema sp.]
MVVKKPPEIGSSMLKSTERRGSTDAKINVPKVARARYAAKPRRSHFLPGNKPIRLYYHNLVYYTIELYPENRATAFKKVNFFVHGPIDDFL